jgi:hypothetical protein
MRRPVGPDGGVLDPDRAADVVGAVSLGLAPR